MQVIKVLCNTGLGSGLYMEMNIRDILTENGLAEQYITSHGALYDVDWTEISHVVVAKDLAPFVNPPPTCELIVVDSVVDKKEMAEKLLARLA